MTRFKKTVLAITVASVLLVPATAMAADPPSEPMKVTAGSGDAATPGVFGFEDTSYTDLTWGQNPTPPGYTPVSWWGRNLGTKHSGSRSLYNSGSPTNSWAQYLQKTSGRATLTLPQLANYYSASLDFWWVQPSLGDADSSSFLVLWKNTSTGQTDSVGNFPKISSWANKVIDVSSTVTNNAVISRQPGQFMFEFNDRLEPESEFVEAYVGQGASIDDVKVTGYYYGPVRSVSEPEPATSNVAISWLKPYKATNSTALEDRSITYKVWRRTSNPGPGAWTELTPAGGTTSLGHTDPTPPSGVALEYQIRAWQSGGSAYGEPVTVFVDQPPAVSDDAQTVYPGSADITIYASDTSGEPTIYYQKDGGIAQMVSGNSTVVSFSGAGDHSLIYWAEDAFGSAADPVTREFTLDETMPFVWSDIQPYYTTDPASITIYADDSSSISMMYWSLDGGPTQMHAGDVKTLSVAGEGAHSIEYWAEDDAANTSEHVIEGFEIDTIIPTAGSDRAAYYTSSPADVTITASDGGSGVDTIHWRVDGGDEQTHAGAVKTVSISGEGVHSLEFWATDEAGNSSAHTSGGLRIDTLDPIATSNAQQYYKTSVASVLISATDAGGSGVKEMRWRVDGGEEQVYAGSSKTVSITGERAHVLEFWAVDNAGNASSYSTANLRIDTANPVATDDHVATYTSMPATITLSATDVGGSGVAYIYYGVDVAPNQVSPGSSIAVGVLTQGAHTIYYYAEDNAGNRSNIKTASFTVDSIAPVPSDNIAASYEGSASFTLSGTDTGGTGVYSIKYILDGGSTVTVYASTKALTVGGAGTHDIEYWVTDVAGNSSGHVEKSFEVTGPDTAPPILNDDVAAYYNVSPAVLHLSATDSGSGVDYIKYTVDSNPEATVAGGSATVNVTGEGTHSVSYYAADTLGNIAAPQVRNFRIDTAAPSAASDAEQYYTSSPAVVTITGSDAGGSGVQDVRWTLDGGILQVSPGVSAVVSITGEGDHELEFYCVDNAGNTSGHTVVAITIDSVAPAISSDAQAYYTSSPANVTMTATDGGSGVASMHWRVDGGTEQSEATASKLVAVTGEGAHTLEFWSVDEAGNESAHEAANLRIDTTDPTVSSDAEPHYTASPASVTITGADGGSGVASVHWRLDGGAEESQAGSSKTVSVYGNGAHSLEIWSVDNAGNASGHTTEDFVIDTIAPTVSDDGTEGAIFEEAQTVTLSASDGSGSGIAMLHWRLNGDAVESHEGAVRAVPVNDDGPQTLEYWAEDAAGNESAHSILSFKIDIAGPVVTPNGAAVYSGSASFALTAVDSVSNVVLLHWELEDGVPHTKTGSALTLSDTVSTSVIGDHTLTYWAEDSRGRSSTHDTFEFQVVAPGTERVSNKTRYSTAVAIAREGFDPSGNKSWPDVKHVIIASGEDRASADPLAAAGLCGVYDAPLFLVSSTAVPAEVKQAINEIVTANELPITVHIVGGPVSVPDARFTEINAYVGGTPTMGLTKDRILKTGGRYDLAAAIARRMKSVNGVAPTTVLVANGADSTKFFDALALSPIAAQRDFPILLVSATSIPPATQGVINEFKPTLVVVGGGPNTVSKTVVSTLKAARWYGGSRYTTAIAIANNAISRGWLDYDVVGIAAKLPDALSGGSMVGLQGGVLLLTDGTSLTGETGTWLSARKAGVQQTYVFGGPNSVTATVLAQIDAKLD